MLALALVATPGAVRGQLAPGSGVRAGTPLRVYVRDAPPRKSVFAYASSSALVVRERCDSCTDVLAISWGDLTRVDAQVSGGASAARVLAGGLVGASVTTLALYIAATNMRCNFDGGDCPGLALVISGPYLIAAGTALGVIAGSQIRTRRWVRVR
jgi:hypothetical protein